MPLPTFPEFAFMPLSGTVLDGGGGGSCFGGFFAQPATATSVAAAKIVSGARLMDGDSFMTAQSSFMIMVRWRMVTRFTAVTATTTDPIRQGVSESSAR